MYNNNIVIILNAFSFQVGYSVILRAYLAQKKGGFSSLDWMVQEKQQFFTGYKLVKWWLQFQVSFYLCRFFAML